MKIYLLQISGILEKLFLRPEVFGTNIFYTPQCMSTAALAKQQLECGERTPLAVFTSYQTQGRGQANKKWISDPFENLLFSLIYPLNSHQETNTVRVNKAITIAIADSIRHFVNFQEEVKIKWPNDIYIKDKKCAGILLETFMHKGNLFLNAGIGINVLQENWPAELYNPTSIKSNSDLIPEIDTVFDFTIGNCVLNLSKREYYLIDNFDLNHAFDKLLWKQNEWIEMKFDDGNIENQWIKISSVNNVGQLVGVDKEGNSHAFTHGNARIKVDSSL